MSDKFYGLLGRKLGHSWSAPIHRALGCEDYRLIELEPEELGAFLARKDYGALNVTIPYKRDVMPFCDVIDDAALEIGSVNTICRRADGKLYAWNTDAAGFAWLAARAGIVLHGRKVVILGSGGTSLTAQAVSRMQGAREIVVISRTGENNYTNLERHADAEVVINTTPVGMFPGNGESPVDLRRFPKCRGVLDMIYNPRRTAFLMQAEELGIPGSDGLPMLVAQARAAEEHFFEKSIPDSENERILSALRRDCTNIVLIGMPGCGKSTVGKTLAAISGREAIDIDSEIVRAAGMPIPEIFRVQGEAAFRALEREAIADAGKQLGKIILTGGGAVKDRSNYAPLHQNGRIYHLIRSLDALSTEGRPLSQTADLFAMWRERRPLYEAFRDVQIANDSTIEEAAARIWRDFLEHSGD